jgi:hypothetical protein
VAIVWTPCTRFWYLLSLSRYDALTDEKCTGESQLARGLYACVRIQDPAVREKAHLESRFCGEVQHA